MLRFHCSRCCLTKECRFIYHLQSVKSVVRIAFENNSISNILGDYMAKIYSCFRNTR